MTARDFILALAVVLALILGLAAYAYFFRKPAPPAAIDPGTIGYALA